MSKPSNPATGALHLTSIELTTAEGQPVKLGIDEARALYAQLHELFGEKEIRIDREPYPVLYPSGPIWIIPRETFAPWSPRWGEITCGPHRTVTTADASGLSVRYSGTIS